MESKSKRITLEQREIMLNFMRKHPSLATNRFMAPDGAKQKQRLLNELNTALNSVANGVNKSCDKWLKVPFSTCATNYTAVLGQLLEEGLFVDCTLASEGRYLKAHKAVLSAASVYFEMVSQRNAPSCGPEVSPRDTWEESSQIMPAIDCGSIKSSMRRCDENVCKSELPDSECSDSGSSVQPAFECEFSTLVTDIEIKEQDEEIYSEVKMETDGMTARMEDVNGDGEKEVSRGQHDGKTQPSA